MSSPLRQGSKKKVVPAAVASALLPLLVLAALAVRPQAGTAQGLVELGADANISGNSATSIGTLDGCIGVSTGDTFDLDIFVSNVDELVAWELYLKFDPNVLEVMNADMNMFLASNPRSSLTVLSVPLSGGRYFLGAADTKDPESGSGVLARVTMKAKAPGTSEAKFLYQDFDGDGDLDFGPRLTGVGGIAIGDSTGDGVYDDPAPKDALVAVDESCSNVPPASTTPPAAPGGQVSPADTPPDGSTPPGLGQDARNELVRVFGVEPDDETEPSTDVPEGDSGSEGDEGSGTSAGSEDSAEPAVLAGEREPLPSGAGDADGGAGDTTVEATPNSSGDGLPWLTIGAIIAGALVVAAGTSVFLVARSGGRFGR